MFKISKKEELNDFQVVMNIIQGMQNYCNRKDTDADIDISVYRDGSELISVLQITFQEADFLLCFNIVPQTNNIYIEEDSDNVDVEAGHMSYADFIAFQGHFLDYFDND